MLTPTEYSRMTQAESVEFTIDISDPHVLNKLKELFGDPYEQWVEKLDIYTLVVEYIQKIHREHFTGASS